MKLLFMWVVGLLLHLGGSSKAEGPIPATDLEAEVFTTEELDLLLGPIALYPDPLLAVILTASTQPAEIVRAVRYFDEGGELSRMETPPWSAPVVALAHYPEALWWMDENLDWTAQLGRAFLVQPEAVMNTIQRLRTLAQLLGNLMTSPQQRVEIEDGEIDLIPTDPEIIYLPNYDPLVIFTRAAAYGAPAYLTYRPGQPIGPWLKFDWDWPNKRVVVWTQEHARPRSWWSHTRSERYRTAEKCVAWSPRAGPGRAKFWSTPRTASEPKSAPSPTRIQTSPAPSISQRVGPSQNNITPSRTSGVVARSAQ